MVLVGIALIAVVVVVLVEAEITAKAAKFAKTSQIHEPKSTRIHRGSGGSAHDDLVD